MSKAARNRRFRRQALIIDPTGKRTISIARALRRHGRMPLEGGKAGGGSREPWRWTSRNRRFAKKIADFRRGVRS